MWVRGSSVPILLLAGTASSLGGCGSDTEGMVDSTAGGADVWNTGGSTGGSDIDGDPGTGGVGTGGSTGGDATGGVRIDGRATGGVGDTEATGGRTATGGAAVTGGTPATGGATATGGDTPTGGATATGGAATMGGATTTGGVTATGGAAATGGVMATGGTTATGGEGADASGGSAGTSSSSCLDGITDYASNGPFDTTTQRSGSVNLLIPQVPAGCKIPMVHYSNGTSATCSFYSASLARLASHGFLTLCYENPNTGAGRYGIEAFETALEEYPDLADYKFGSIGHSQGGMASLVTLQYAEAQWGDIGIYAGLAVEPASGFGDNPSEPWQTIYGRCTSPVFMFSGLGTDTLVSQSWVQQAFDALDDSIEAYFWTKAGANHIGTVNQDANEVSVSWFRWKLLGDRNACQYFQSIPTVDGTWAVEDTQNEVACD